MKLQAWFQRLMVIVAVMLLIACLVTGTPTDPVSPSAQSFLWMLTLVICIGTVGLCASGAEKPLGWVIVGAFIGSAVCLCEVMGLSDTIRAPKLFFGLYLLEFLLSTSYGICRRFHVFV